MSATSQQQKRDASKRSLLHKVEQVRKDFLGFAPTCLKIADKLSGRLISFRPNVAQMYAHKMIEAQHKRTGRVRVVVSKGRQQGVSTYTQGRFYWKVTGQPGRQAFILTHEQGATDTIFSMTERYHRNTPKFMRPSIGASNAKEMLFDKLDSGYRVGTAGNKTVGRSNRTHYFHASEVAFWPNADQHLAGLLQTVPDAPDTEVIVESTSNGVGGVYYDYAMEAQAGEGEYDLIFIPWFWQPEYRKQSFRSEGRMLTPDNLELTEEEQYFVAEYNLDMFQVLWRRSKIHELKSPDLFRQEYPFTLEESFVASGRGVFAGLWMQRVSDNCFRPSTIATITLEGIMERVDGDLKIWEAPRKGVKYFLSGDPAEGLAKGDNSVLQVLDADGHQVAEFCAHLEPDLLAKYAAILGKWYNKALIIIERNNHGQLVNHVLAREVGYPRIYMEEAEDHLADGKIVRKYGWLTTTRTKPMIIDNLVSMVRDDNSGIASKELAAEMVTYVVDDRGRTNAQSGKLDDRVMAYAIGQFVRKKNTKKKKRWTEANVASASMSGSGKRTPGFGNYSHRKPIDGRTRY
jgi:hypothetical protein